jgi:hypothetical protein
MPRGLPRDAGALLVAALGLAALALLSACIVQVREIKVEPVEPTAPGTDVRSPVKAHLLDGTTVVFPRGVLVGPALHNCARPRRRPRRRPPRAPPRRRRASLGGLEG